jgi:type VI secretion system protein ImpL
MQRFLNGLTHSRTLSIIGVLALAAVLFIAADTLQIDPIWAAAALGAVLVLWFLIWLVRRLLARRANRKLGDMLEQQAEKQTEAGAAATPARQAELDALRTSTRSRPSRPRRSARFRAARRSMSCRGTS